MGDFNDWLGSIKNKYQQPDIGHKMGSNALITTPLKWPKIDRFDGLTSFCLFTPISGVMGLYGAHLVHLCEVVTDRNLKPMMGNSQDLASVLR